MSDLAVLYNERDKLRREVEELKLGNFWREIGAGTPEFFQPGSERYNRAWQRWFGHGGAHANAGEQGLYQEK